MNDRSSKSDPDAMLTYKAFLMTQDDSISPTVSARQFCWSVFIYFCFRMRLRHMKNTKMILKIKLLAASSLRTAGFDIQLVVQSLYTWFCVQSRMDS
jgi:hypothetical protein